MGRQRIYLDNAATSWPKPDGVYTAVDDYQRQLGAPAGRGVYAEAVQVDRQIGQTRLALARLIDAPDPNRIILTYSGTDSLTLAIRGLLRPGDHVVTSVCDHNAVLRPLRYLEQRGDIAVTRVGCDPDGCLAVDDVVAACRDNTRLVALVHASNVTGAIQPIHEVAERIQGRPARLLVDAAQTVGHIPLSVKRLGCDLLASPGHKGLLGPTGTGFLYLAPGLEHEVEPFRLGGTGSQSDSDLPPSELPDRYEAGNLNVPGIFGLAAGLDYLNQMGIETIAQHEALLIRQLLDGLSKLPGVTVYGPADPQRRVGVVSFRAAGHDPQELSVLLDQVAGIQTRAGFHCAPLMHRALQTHTVGGTVRLSCGVFNRMQDAELVVETLGQLLA